MRPETERVRVVGGRAADPNADRAAVDAALRVAVGESTPVVRAWKPHRHVAFGRRDAREEGYDRARSAAEEHGYRPIERSVGGRAVAYSGTTVAFAAAIPTPDPRSGIGARYDAATSGVVRALRTLGVPARRGEPDAAFCPGEHSVQAHGKIAGIAQRVRRDAALVSGIVITTDHEAIAAVLDPIYEALGVPFDPDSVGSVARSGSTAAPDPVVDALLDAFCSGLKRDPIDVTSLLDDG
ncbi:lipoate--protein ligase family protein [Halobellus sp. MBLA0160]|uniref:Lipoate--protein ligase family protein n=1 Tax=Halobellus ruber TaxID=2761102 RepID=A0A7J9SK87_9EURY|nr:lipoate--protein ligase family protein [Halobellus ruber]